MKYLSDDLFKYFDALSDVGENFYDQVVGIAYYEVESAFSIDGLGSNTAYSMSMIMDRLIRNKVADLNERS